MKTAFVAALLAAVALGASVPTASAQPYWHHWHHHYWHHGWGWGHPYWHHHHWCRWHPYRCGW